MKLSNICNFVHKLKLVSENSLRFYKAFFGFMYMKGFEIIFFFLNSFKLYNLKTIRSRQLNDA